MGKRKYLIFFFLIFYPQLSLSSAWLPPLGSYKFSITNLFIDNYSKSLKAQRIQRFQEIELDISLLILQKSIVKKCKIKNKVILQKIIDQKIIKLKKNLIELASFDTDNIITTSFEQRISTNSSLGIKILRKESGFTNSLYITSKTKYEEMLKNIFYKYILYENKNNIFTISPQIFVKQSVFFNDEFSYEVSLLHGVSKLKKHFEIFTDTAFTIGLKPVSGNRSNLNYCFSVNEGVKFNNGVMLSNFIKYSYDNNNILIYKKSLYEQISLATTFKPINKKEQELTLSIGYFWEKSLIKKNYHYSGLTFSLVVVL